MDSLTDYVAFSTNVSKVHLAATLLGGAFRMGDWLPMTTLDIISPTDPHTQVTISATDEFLIVAVGAYIIPSGPVAISNSVANLSGGVDIEGSITGLNGIDLSYSSGDGETIDVGGAGSVVGATDAVDLFGPGGAQLVQNAGSVRAVAGNGVVLNAVDARIENTGTISGGDDAVQLVASGALVENDAGGVITAGNGDGVRLQASDDSISNAGTISSTSATGAAISAVGSTLVVSSGDIRGVSAVVFFSAGDDSVQNSGTISATGNAAIDVAGDNDNIYNSGKISADDDTIDLGGSGSGTDWIFNETGAAIESQGLAILSTKDATHVVNHGDIAGSMSLRADDSVFANTGNFSGEATFLTGGVTIRNAGTINDSGIQSVHIGGVSGEDDRFVNTVGAIVDAAGETAIFHGTVGTFRIVNHGDIYGSLNLQGAASIANVGLISGNVTFGLGGSVLVNRVEIDGNVFFAGTGNIYRGQSGEVTGTIFGAGADGRYMGGPGDDTFDMTASGAKYVSGGAGDDTFIFTAAGLTAPTRVLGGAGDDALTFTTVATFSPSAFAHVSGIETINLAAGNNNLALTNSLVNSTDNGMLTINGNNFVDTIDASAVTTATDTVIMYGGHGADVMTAGGAKDVFLYQAVNESSGTVYDTVAGVNFNIDRFDVSAAAKTVLAVNTAVTVGSLSTATFNADLATDLPAAKLGAHDAVLFTANAGTLSGQTFLVIDANGTAGYQANADLVIHLTGQTGTLTTGSFG